MKMRPVRAKVFHWDTQFSRHDSANSHFSQLFCEYTKKVYHNVPEHSSLKNLFLGMLIVIIWLQSWVQSCMSMDNCQYFVLPYADL